MADYRKESSHYGSNALSNKEQARALGLQAACSLRASPMASVSDVVELAEMFANYIMTGEHRS